MIMRNQKKTMII